MTWVPTRNIAEWNLTYRCDLRCRGCNHMVIYPGHTPDMTVADAEEFIRQARELNWQFTTILILGGEPTLHPDLDRFIELVHDFLQAPGWLLSNGYSEKAKAILARYADDKRVQIIQRTIKPDGSVTHLLQDYFLDPTDIGETREPCVFHTAYPARKAMCGVSVDAKGYTVCPVGGAIDGVLKLGVRTRRLADLLDSEFADRQTKILCSHCGCGWGRYHTFPEVETIEGTVMSPTWAKAVNRGKGC